MDRDLVGYLSTFLAVADEGNFTRAAHRLGVSQSAVSHTVRRLEDRSAVVQSQFSEGDAHGRG